MATRKLTPQIVDVEPEDQPSGSRLSRLLASLAFAGFGLLLMIRLIDYYMATRLFGYVFESLRGTWLPDEITQALAVLITGIAALYIPVLSWRLFFGFSFSPKWATRARTFLGFKPQYKRSLIALTLLWSTWIGFSYWVSMPAKGEIFNPYTASPRYKYFKDESGWITEFPIGYQVHPDTGETLSLFTVDVAKQYRQQRKKADTPTSQVPKAVTKEVALKSSADDASPCAVFVGGSKDFVFAKSGTGMRLWIKKIEFFSNKTIVSLAVTPGAATDSLKWVSWTTFQNDSEEIGYFWEHTIAKTFGTTAEYDLWWKDIDQFYAYSVTMGPIQGPPYELYFNHPGFKLYRVHVDPIKCPGDT